MSRYLLYDPRLSDNLGAFWSGMQGAMQRADDSLDREQQRRLRGLQMQEAEERLGQLPLERELKNLQRRQTELNLEKSEREQQYAMEMMDAIGPFSERVGSLTQQVMTEMQRSPRAWQSPEDAGLEGVHRGVIETEILPEFASLFTKSYATASKYAAAGVPSAKEHVKELRQNAVTLGKQLQESGVPGVDKFWQRHVLAVMGAEEEKPDLRMVTSGNAVVGVDPKTGQKVSEFEMPKERKYIATKAGGDGFTYVLFDDGSAVKTDVPADEAGRLQDYIVRAGDPNTPPKERARAESIIRKHLEFERAKLVPKEPSDQETAIRRIMQERGVPYTDALQIYKSAGKNIRDDERDVFIRTYNALVGVGTPEAEASAQAAAAVAAYRKTFGERGAGGAGPDYAKMAPAQLQAAFDAGDRSPALMQAIRAARAAQKKAAPTPSPEITRRW